jgi:N-acetylglutamate synthase-like GNAT family acetyltransferase
VVTIRVGTTRDIGKAAALYRHLGYGGGIQATDRLVLAEARGRLVGLLRLALEQGTTVLRGMRVVPALQRRGVGTAILRAAAKELGAEACYGIAYVHLKSFYAQIGFREISPAEAPSFLADRLARYRSERPEAALYLMHRSSSTLPDGV